MFLSFTTPMVCMVCMINAMCLDHRSGDNGLVPVANTTCALIRETYNYTVENTEATTKWLTLYTKTAQQSLRQYINRLEVNQTTFADVSSGISYSREYSLRVAYATQMQLLIQALDALTSHRAAARYNETANELRNSLLQIKEDILSGVQYADSNGYTVEFIITQDRPPALVRGLYHIYLEKTRNVLLNLLCDLCG